MNPPCGRGSRRRWPGGSGGQGLGCRVVDLVGRTPLLRLERLVAALAVGREAPGSTIVTILPDSGTRYVSERFWTEADAGQELGGG